MSIDRLLADAASARGAMLATTPASSLSASFAASTRVRDLDFPSEAHVLPDELLVAVAESERRCFCLRDGEGRLLPSALWLGDPTLDERSQRRAMGELQSRLREVAAGYLEALQESPETWRERIGEMPFHLRLGTIGDRAARLPGLAALVANQGNLQGLAADAAHVASLSELDFGTRLVQEDPSLHALLGSALFAARGESKLVTAALASHVEPRDASARAPEDALGAVVSVAARLDTLLGAFSHGFAPTPTDDPLLARGLAYGLVRVLFAHSIDVELGELVNLAAERLPSQGAWLSSRDASIRVFGFLRHRLKVLLCQQYPEDAVHEALQGERVRPARIQRWLHAEFG